MGIYDRDWYRENQNKETAAPKRSDRFTKGLITGLIVGFVIGFLIFGFI